MNQSSAGFRRTSWGVRVLLAVVFGSAGTCMLLAIPTMVALFAKIGIGQWFRIVTGVLEVSGAVLLLIPATGRLAASLLLVIMLAGVVTHWFVIGGSAIPAIVLGTACGWLVKALRHPTSQSAGFGSI